MARKHYTDVIGTLGSGGLTNVATTHTFTALTYVNGTAVPTLTTGESFLVSILDASGNVLEVVNVTAYNSGTKAATIARAQEGTTAIAHAGSLNVANGVYPTDLSPWQKLVDLPMTSLTDWTGSGTGASWGLTGSGSVIRDAGSPGNNVHLNTYQVPTPLDCTTIECEIMMNSTNNTSSSRAGFVFGSGSSAAQVTLQAGVAGNTSHVDYEYSGVSNPGKDALPANIAHGTWITLSVRKTGPSVSAWVNGTYIGSADFVIAEARRRLFSLYTYAADASFRNLKVWTTGVPA